MGSCVSWDRLWARASQLPSAKHLPCPSFSSLNCFPCRGLCLAAGFSLERGWECGPGSAGLRDPAYLPLQRICAPHILLVSKLC